MGTQHEDSGAISTISALVPYIWRKLRGTHLSRGTILPRHHLILLCHLEQPRSSHATADAHRDHDVAGTTTLSFDQRVPG